MPPLTSRARMMRAILLARATVTSIFGLRANICASHEPLGAPRRLACRTTALAPMISRSASLRMRRSKPIRSMPVYWLSSQKLGAVSKRGERTIRRLLLRIGDNHSTDVRSDHRGNRSCIAGGFDNDNVTPGQLFGQYLQWLATHDDMTQ